MALAFAQTTRITMGWELCLTKPGTLTTPPDPHSDLDWIPAAAPGTAAEALMTAGRFDPLAPIPLDDHDIWYRAPLAGTGMVRLGFEGLATIAEIWLDGTFLLRSTSMFVAQEVEVELKGEHWLWLCFRSLSAYLADPERPKPKRARWRPRMIQPTTLNAVRTTILGHASGWCPAIHAVGPYRPVTFSKRGSHAAIRDARLATRYLGGVGMLDCVVEFDGNGHIEPANLFCAGHCVAMIRGTSSVSGRRTLFGRLEIPDIKAWWPHTHGEPVLHDVEIEVGGERLTVGRTGFREMTVDRGSDGNDFALRVNGVPVFCRGACWTPIDLVSLQCSHDDFAARLRLMVEAGMNMVRIGGTMVYETKTFHDLCDELGILVWQDFMFANFDYPNDPAFMDDVTREAEQLLLRLSGSPSLAILCGGSEVYQQGAMMGMPEQIWRNAIFEAALPEICTMFRPDVPFVVNSPSGGALPFFSESGIAHYYGVGAYLRPLDDARRAHIRFAAECLAFANIPEEASLRQHEPDGWRAGVPRDAGADWDFADVRDHYLSKLFSCDPATLREDDPPRYRQLSRAAIAHVVQHTFTEWRREGSATHGGLLWFLQDLCFGSGWGILDSTGQPKSIWHALKHILQPLQILLTDEGVNGLLLHAINETDRVQPCRLRLRCLRDGLVTVVEGSKEIELQPRSTRSFPATDLFGGFFDTTYAFRFGPPGHDVTIAELFGADGITILSRQCHFPLGVDGERHELGLAARLVETAGVPQLLVSTARFAAFVEIDCDNFRPADNWFHLGAGETRLVDLKRLALVNGAGRGTVRAVNGLDAVSFGQTR